MPKPVDLPLPKTEVTPDPEVEKRTRRTFSAEYKLRIIAEAAQCRHGELGALLRRENLYSNQLQGKRPFQAVIVQRGPGLISWGYGRTWFSRGVA
jgi:hypothetical protein